MKKTTYALLLLLLIADLTYPQYQIIYQPPANRTIQTIASFRNNLNPSVSFYLSLSGHSVNTQPPFWIRYYKNSGSWDVNPHNGFLGGSTCFSGTGGFGWSRTALICRSAVDTNFFLTRFDWQTCINPESGYRNKVTYTSGTGSQDIQNIGLYDFEIDKVNDSLIFGVGAMYLSTGKFWASTNKGASWSSTSTSGGLTSAYKLKVNPLRRSEIYFSVNQQLYRTTNSGTNFTLVNTFAADVLQIEIDPVDSTLFVLTSNRNVYRSTNGGSNFSLVSGVSLDRIIFTPENHLKLYGAAQNGLYISTNGGVNWLHYFDNFSGSSVVNGIVKYPNDGDTVYASNSSGLYKIWASVIGITQVSTEIPEVFSLSQNYPNPFNPSTKIKFSIPPGNSVAQTFLSVFDVLGKEVAALVNQKLQPGTYEVNWNASELPSGVYFYKLSAGNFAQTKTMMMIK